MKKIIIFTMAAIFCCIGMARDLGTSWVATREGRIDCKKINVGYDKAHLIFDNGDKRAVPLNDITAYSRNGKVYDRLPIYEEGKPTGKSAFMEFIRDCNGLKLYKLEYFNSNLNARVTSYFLYNGKKLHLDLDANALSNICKQYDIPASSL